MDIDSICKKLRTGAQILALHNAAKKNHALESVVQSIKNNRQKILDANAKDVESARKNGMTESLVERLALDEKKFENKRSNSLSAIVVDTSSPLYLFHPAKNTTS